MAALTLSKVTKSFGKTEVIKGVDLHVDEGEFCVFVGPSGCGKSTLLRLIAGLEDVSAGKVEIDGTDATAVPPAKRGLACPALRSRDSTDAKAPGRRAPGR